MFFCPFCGTLLLVQPLESGNHFCCSTCRYAHAIVGDEPLTVTHSFLHCNKALVDDEDLAITPNAGVGTTRSNSADGNSAATDCDGHASSANTSAGGTSHELERRHVHGDGSEVGQIITIICQNDETQCDSRKAHFVQIQMRSADEPATTFYKCVKCGFQWRQD